MSDDGAARAHRPAGQLFLRGRGRVQPAGGLHHPGRLLQETSDVQERTCLYCFIESLFAAKKGRFTSEMQKRKCLY